MFLCNDDFKIASKENNDRLIALINSNKEFFYTTFTIALTTDYPIAWRASWCLHKVLPNYRYELMADVDRIFNAFPTFTHHGQIASFIRILKSIDFNPENSGNVIDSCLKLFKEEKIPDYVKFYSVELLVQIAHKIPELKNEFALYIEALIPTGKTYMIKVRVKKLLRELKS
tara:strand:+ start:115 stop:630 length:516 start_codon:yes stop_codon:yes gene_type:complete